MAIRLVQDHAEADDCRFWVGLFRKGDLDVMDLFSCRDLEIFFDTLAIQGINASSTIVLSDAVEDTPRFFFLSQRAAPAPPNREVVSSLGEELMGSMTAFKPQEIGVYLAPELADLILLKELIVSFFKDYGPKLNSLFLLCGQYDRNEVLNSALMIKEELEGFSDLTVEVLH